MLTDTIAAISTGNGNTGINIIRITGKEAKNIIKKVFNNSKKLSHQKIIYGKIINPINKKTIDEVLVSYFKGPNSFTGEDVCEINCHGGRQVTLEILEYVLQSGARLAEPGEFSKRAFLNGKMDLSKAEGIIDLINAKTKSQTQIAINQLEGGIFKLVKEKRDRLLDLLANIEVNIDYPEYDYEELNSDKILEILTKTEKDINKIVKEYSNGKYLKNGINVAILGGPNAGKSTLLNVLSKTNKAIVTDIEGTTRDIVEETIVLDNILLNLADTAGIRETDNIVEKIGIKRSIEIIDKVDVVIYLIDSSKGVTEKDKEIIKLVKSKNKPIIICFNKTDISREIIDKNNGLESEEYIETSFLLGIGIEKLKEAIIKKLKISNFERMQDEIVVNERHKELLIKVLEQLSNAIEEIKKKSSVDIIEINIKEATDKLGEIIGENISDDVINKIFEKFCLGK